MPNNIKRKKLHWFHTDEDLWKDKITLANTDLVHQLSKVLKFHPKETITLTDGNGIAAVTQIEEIDESKVVVSVINRESREVGKKKVNLYFAIPKKNFEIILEKGTEIGIHTFHPIITDRTEKLNIKSERAEKIIKEATELSERFFKPKIFEPQELDDILKRLTNTTTFVFHTTGENFWKKDIDGEINILIGPEGGWSDKEIQDFDGRGFQIFRVGDGILKTETAAITIPSLFLY